MLLKVRDLGFRYGKEKWLFRGVNLDLQSGEIVGLMGPSGSGKTTLARILSGYENAHEGSVTLDGTALPRSEYYPVQLVFQHPEKAVNGRWKIEKILREGCVPDQELLVSLGIEKAWLSRWPHELSGGELQRICIARVLGPKTKFLIADEMTTMLDPITQAQIWQVVLEIAQKRSLGVLVISHERSLLQRVCHRVLGWDEWRML